MLVYNSASGESVRSWQAATQEYTVTQYFCVPFWNLKHCINPRTKSCIIYRYTFAAKHWQDLDAVGIESIGVYQYWCISEQSINRVAGPYLIVLVISSGAIAKERTGRSWLQQSPSKTDVSCLPGNQLLTCALCSAHLCTVHSSPIVKCALYNVLCTL